MPDIDEKEFAHALLALEQDPQPIHLELGKTEAWSLLSTIQLAARYPIATATVDKAVEVIKRHEWRIAQNDLVLKEVILAGWENRSPNHSQHSAAAAMIAASSDIKLIINKYEAWCLIGAIQLAYRHPEFKGSGAADTTEGLARELQRAIAPEGILAGLLEMGWDESADVEQNSKNSRAFTGELMTCVVCGSQHRSDPDIESQWRLLEVDDDVFYVCPEEFPEDGSGKDAFAKAYKTAIACCLNERLKRLGQDVDPLF